ncbi:unnamed protein product [Ilex paraguariensis]|uniref:Uncharacterized protein n=1 Tax=Ilex paraguariensis TaxID=185542 RepID=A0ABC8UTT1_9AQUA
MRQEEVAFGSVADLTFRFWHNKACTIFSHLGARRAIVFRLVRSIPGELEMSILVGHYSDQSGENRPNIRYAEGDLASEKKGKQGKCELTNGKGRR